MSKPANIAQQIEKYLNGELDARAMHQLEREAQNDPFLMDALEGYSKAGNNQQANLDDITGRLQQRTTKGKVRSILMWRLAAAASIIVVLGAVSLWLYNDKPKINENVLSKQVDVVKPSEPIVSAAPEKADSTLQTMVKKPSTDKSPYIASVKKEKISRKKKSHPVADLAFEPNAIQTDTAIRKGASLDEIIVVGYATQRKTSVTGAMTSVSANEVQQKILSGRVTDELKQPIPGVIVTSKEKGTVTQTDAQGYFSIPVIPNKTKLDLSFIGFKNKQVKVKGQDSLMIAMVPDQSSLSEVVVVGYGSNKKIKEAHPINGWDDFKEYLKENAISPDGKEGTVKLSFVVNADGSLTDFEITKNLSDETDQQAIALVKDGPKWVADSSGQPKKVKLSIKFRAE